MALYKGFSTKQYGKCDGFGTNVSFALQDVELVKQDLLNHIFTSKGERVMQPTFGTIIPDILFEPMDTAIISLIEDEIAHVVRSDPRVQLLNLSVVPTEDLYTITVNLLLQYVELNIVDGFNLSIVFE
jgi:phage baseplate assembly protein W